VTNADCSICDDFFLFPIKVISWDSISARMSSLTHSGNEVAHVRGKRAGVPTGRFGVASRRGRVSCCYLIVTFPAAAEPGQTVLFGGFLQDVESDGVMLVTVVARDSVVVQEWDLVQVHITLSSNSDEHVRNWSVQDGWGIFNCFVTLWGKNGGVGVEAASSDGDAMEFSDTWEAAVFSRVCKTAAATNESGHCWVKFESEFEEGWTLMSGRETSNSLHSQVELSWEDEEHIVEAPWYR